MPAEVTEGRFTFLVLAGVTSVTCTLACDVIKLATMVVSRSQSRIHMPVSDTLRSAFLCNVQALRRVDDPM